MSESRAQTDVIEACKRGDTDAFHELFLAHKDRVYSVALHFSGNEAAARDVTQQVFLKLFTSLGQFRREAEFTTWLYRIVVNADVDDQRKRRGVVHFDPHYESRRRSIGGREARELH